MAKDPIDEVCEYLTACKLLCIKAGCVPGDWITALIKQAVDDALANSLPSRREETIRMMLKAVTGYSSAMIQEEERHAIECDEAVEQAIAIIEKPRR